MLVPDIFYRGLKKLRGAGMPLVLLAAAGLWFADNRGRDISDSLSGEAVFSSESVHAIFTRNPWNDQSPLFPLLLHFWKYFGESPMTVRAFVMVLTAVMMAFFYRLARKHCGEPVAAAGLVLFAFSPLSLWFIRNGRMYPIVVLTTLASVYAVWAYLDTGRFRHLAGLVAASVIGIYTHFFGFYITAWVFLYLAVLLVQRRLSFRAWAAAGAAAASIGLLSLFQINRVIALMKAPPMHNDAWSVAPTIRGFFNAVLYLFHLGRPGWVEAAGFGNAFQTLFWIVFFSLFVIGLVLSRPRIRFIALLMSVGSMLVLGLLAKKLDIRDRYAVYIVPLVYMVQAHGAWAPFRLPRFSGLHGFFDALRKALFFVLLVQMLLITFSSVGARYCEWTKVMNGIDRVYTPNMTLWMPTAYAVNLPIYAADASGLNPALRDVRITSPGTRQQFLEEVERGGDIVYVIHEGRVSPELDWQIKFLGEQGYRRESLHGWNARAELFSKKPLQGLYTAEAVPEGDQGLIQWAVGELGRRPGTGGFSLKTALAARVDGGRVIASDLYLDQAGRYGWWKLPGVNYVDSVFEDDTAVGGVPKFSVRTTLRKDWGAVVGYPNVRIGKVLELVYGEPVSPKAGNPNPVEFELYLNGDKITKVLSTGDDKWRSLHIDTSRYAGQTAHVLLVAVTQDAAQRSLCFRLRVRDGGFADKLSDIAAAFEKFAPFRSGPRPPPKIRFKNEHMNKAPNDAEIAAWARARHAPVAARVHADGRIVVGADLGKDFLGGTHWLLGKEEWEAVYGGRFLSGGAEREMIWAHPAGDAVLVVGFPGFKTAENLDVFYGIADSGLWNESGAEVQMDLWIEGKLAASIHCPNTKGWKKLTVDTRPLAGAASDVVALIRTTDSTARHFCFNLRSSAEFRLDMTGGKKMSGLIQRLDAVRMLPDGSVLAPLRFEVKSNSASEMHEKGGPDGEGQVKERWVFGPDPWDAVGIANLRSGGVLRQGIWAHPRTGGVLQIEADGVRLGRRLEGYIGLSDLAVAQCKEKNNSSPVRFKLLLDSKMIWEKEIPRTGGWVDFSVILLPEIKGSPHRLTATVETENQTWTHFVFDCWSK